MVTQKTAISWGDTNTALLLRLPVPLPLPHHCLYHCPITAPPLPIPLPLPLTPPVPPPLPHRVPPSPMVCALRGGGGGLQWGDNVANKLLGWGWVVQQKAPRRQKDSHPPVDKVDSLVRLCCYNSRVSAAVRLGYFPRLG